MKADRLVLANVERVGFHKPGKHAPMDTPLPTCVALVVERIGEDHPLRYLVGPNTSLHNTHTNLMGISGAAFRCVWRKGGGGLINVLDMGDDAFAPVREMFAAIGYEPRILLRKEYAKRMGIEQEQDYTQQQFLEEIRGSLGRDLPVIAIGGIGEPEPCIISGYDAGGQVLIGWNYFQGAKEHNHGVEFEPSGQFRKRDWHDGTRGLIVFGDKVAAPPLGQIHRRALANAVKVLRATSARGVPAGPAAWQAWADDLRNDADFPADKPEVLKKRRWETSFPVGDLVEARAWGAPFLWTVAELNPAIGEDVRKAAECMDRSQALLRKLWELDFAKPADRQKGAEILLQIRDAEAEVAAHLEDALAHPSGEAAVDPRTLYQPPQR